MNSNWVRNCRKVVCIGRNYADHIKELKNQAPKNPFYFLKPPSSILLPGNGNIISPRGVKLYYEVELALIMGNSLTNLHPTDLEGALDSIQGM